MAPGVYFIFSIYFTLCDRITKTKKHTDNQLAEYFLFKVIIMQYTVYICPVHPTQLVTANKNEYFSAHFALHVFQPENSIRTFTQAIYHCTYLSLSDSFQNPRCNRLSFGQSVTNFGDEKQNYPNFRMLFFPPFLSVNNNNSVHVCYLLLKQVIVKVNITLSVTYES